MAGALNIIATLFKTFWTIIKYPLFLIAICAVFFFLLFLFFCALEFKSGKRLKKGERYRSKRPSLFKTFFWLAPKQFAIDFFDRNPEDFNNNGIIIFTGRQGYGKTIALIEQTMRYQEMFPKVKVLSNCAYKYEDEELNHWRQLIDYNNGKKGVIVLMDELQNWFSSNQSKNFPEEMLEQVTQNRKNTRLILATSQVFNRVAKPLREQIKEERQCFTLFHVITFVHRVRLVLDSEGYVKQRKHLGFYCFAQTPEIRNAYDTYKCIESLARSGFKEQSMR